ncbi:hypothetical protein [Candidatus Cytomitobacter primus]|uniref:Uncharacterized protein n=1 Tax=Candidatus Cytomitobacter primus TaxID=2066024 RepID=A0A5C0UFB5_9PROT|nr:hypothetical protein [Candidatus Cytomitobacter primus]QEK38785.1 hypothetical protein FZC34_02630 [Candidatus Cytomitobacter primus]
MKNLRILSLVLCLSVMANGPELTECTSKFAYCLKKSDQSLAIELEESNLECRDDEFYQTVLDGTKEVVKDLTDNKCKSIVYMQMINQDDEDEYIESLSKYSEEELQEQLNNLKDEQATEYAMLRYVYESRSYIMKQSTRYAELADAYGNYDMDGDVFKNAVYLADRSQNGTLEVDWDLESDRLEAHSLYYNSIYEYNLENPGLSMLSDKAEAAKVNATILQSLSKDKEHFTNIAKHIALKKMAVEAAKGLEKFKIMLDEVVRQDASWNVIRTVKVGNAMQKHFKEADKYVKCNY